MKAFFLLLVLSAAGLVGVLYWRQSLHPSKPAVTAAPAPKEGKERRHRRKRGARRLARTEVLAQNDVPGTSSSSPPSRQAPSREAPSNEGPSGDGVSPARATQPEDPAPLAPGGAATTEVEPSDVFGGLTSPTAAPSGGRRQAVAEPEPVKLRATDVKMVWQGEDLSHAESMRLDFSKDAVGHELSQDEIDTRFHTKEDAVLACVARARPDEYTEIPGRVNVRFRIQSSGAVKGVQVEAPAILQRGGLTGCIKGAVGGLRFPASNMAQVITYPFTLM